AARFARIDVAALASALRPRDIGERFLVRNVVGVHTVTQKVVVDWTGEDASERAIEDIGDIVGYAAAVRKSGRVAGKQAQSLAASHRRWRDAGIQPQQVRNRTSR